MWQQSTAALNCDCPVCHGSGWEIYNPGYIEGYGVPQDYARPCPRCKGQARANDRTGVPPQFEDAGLERFGFNSYSRSVENLKKITTDFLYKYKERWEANGKGIYLWSRTPGSGKTFLACCIGKSVMVKHDLQFRFITAPDYLAKVGDSYKRDRGDIDETEVYRKCSLLVLDDLGAQKSGEWQEQELFRLINERLNAGKISIYTSNMPPDSLNLDSRAIGRIKKTAIVLQMPEESIRDKQTQAEQDDFLKDIIGN